MGRRRKREEAPLSLFSFQDIMACLTGILILVALLLAIDGLADEMQATAARGGASAASSSARAAELREQVAVLRRAIDDRKGGVDVTKAEVDVLEDRVRQLAQEADRTRSRTERARSEASRIAAESKAAESRMDRLRERIADALRSAQREALRQRVRFRPGMQYPKSPVFVEPTATGIALGELDADRTPVRIASLADPNAEARLVGALGKRLPDSSYIVFIVRQDSIERFERLRDAMFRRGYEVGWQLWDGGQTGFLDGAQESGGQVPLEVPPAPSPRGDSGESRP